MEKEKGVVSKKSEDLVSKKEVLALVGKWVIPDFAFRKTSMDRRVDKMRENLLADIKGLK